MKDGVDLLSTEVATDLLSPEGLVALITVGCESKVKRLLGRDEVRELVSKVERITEEHMRQAVDEADISFEAGADEDVR